MEKKSPPKNPDFFSDCFRWTQLRSNLIWMSLSGALLSKNLPQYTGAYLLTFFKRLSPFFSCLKKNDLLLSFIVLYIIKDVINTPWIRSSYTEFIHIWTAEFLFFKCILIFFNQDIWVFWHLQTFSIICHNFFYTIP